MLSSSSRTRRCRSSQDELLGARPCGFRCRDVAGAILGLPGEAFAHDMQRRELGKFGQQLRFAGLPGRRLDELHDGDGPAVADVAEDHAKRRRRLALAGAGVDDDQALVARLRRHHLVARRLVLAHLLVVAGVGFVIARGVRHAAVSFSIALSAVSVASIPAALFERGCQSPRRIASWKRLAVSLSAEGFASAMKARTRSFSR